MKNITEFLINKPLINNNSDVIDLGLPSGTLWYNKNLGAESENDPGNYYIWGTSVSVPSKIPVPSNQLTLKDNIVKKTLGNNFDYPTKEDFKELIENTKIYKKYDNAITLVSKINGNHIYFPFTGFYSNMLNCIREQNEWVRLWSSSIEDNDHAYALKGDILNKFKISFENKHTGYPIRPVIHY